MADLVLTAVKKVYPGDVVAVREFDLHVADGEFVVLVGPSGCGKSTTLRMIAGLEEISAGTISIGDRVVNHVPPKDRDIAMVFQNYALYPHMTVYDNMAFGLKLRRMSKPQIRQRIERAAEMLGLDDLLKRRPKALSGGQRQRVAVGRAIVREPAVFLFDEPLSNLDAKLRMQMRAEISRLQRELGTTMVYVTHDQVEAMTMSDRIVLMKDGFVQQVDDPMTLYHRPANRFTEGFIGTPPMNFLRGQVRRAAERVEFVLDDGQAVVVPAAYHALLKPFAEASAGELELGVRPEDLLVLDNNADGIGAVVDLVEPLGSESHLHLRIGAQRCICRVEGITLPGVGETLRAGIRPEHLHFFEMSSGRRLG